MPPIVCVSNGLCLEMRDNGPRQLEDGCRRHRTFRFHGQPEQLNPGGKLVEDSAKGQGLGDPGRMGGRGRTEVQQGIPLQVKKGAGSGIGNNAVDEDDVIVGSHQVQEAQAWTVLAFELDGPAKSVPAANLCLQAFNDLPAEGIGAEGRTHTHYQNAAQVRLMFSRRKWVAQEMHGS